MDFPSGPQVRIPDNETRNIIDKLAQFVARNGPDFELMTKSKQKNNPKFSFLYGGEYYNYYQYKVSAEQAILKQQSTSSGANNVFSNPPSLANVKASLQQWIAANIQPVNKTATNDNNTNVTNSIMAIPSTPVVGVGPSSPQNISVDQILVQQTILREQIRQSERNLAAQHSALIRRQQEQIDETVTKTLEKIIEALAQECDIQLSELDTILQPIIESCTKDSISTGKGWILSHSTSNKHAQCISQYLLLKVCSEGASFNHKLHLIYLVNDVLHHCARKNVEELKKCFENVVIPMFGNASVDATEEQIAKLEKLLTLWESKANYFDSVVVGKLKNPVVSYQEYKAQIISQHAAIITPLTQATKTIFEGYQRQHEIFISYSLRQIQILEAQKKHEHGSTNNIIIDNAGPTGLGNVTSNIQSNLQAIPPNLQSNIQPIMPPIQPNMQPIPPIIQSVPSSIQSIQTNISVQASMPQSQPNIQPVQSPMPAVQISSQAGQTNMQSNAPNMQPVPPNIPPLPSNIPPMPPNIIPNSMSVVPTTINAIQNIHINSISTIPQSNIIHNSTPINIPNLNMNMNNSLSPSLQNNIQQSAGPISMFNQFEIQNQNNINYSENNGTIGMPPGLSFTQPPPIYSRFSCLPDLSKPPPGFGGGPTAPAIIAPTAIVPNIPPAIVSMPVVDTTEVAEDLTPSMPYYELPAGLMVPLIKLEDTTFDPLEPSEIRLPPPAAPNERLLAAVEAFYAAPCHERPRDSDGWEKLALYEYYKAKSAARKKEDEGEISRIRSHSISPILREFSKTNLPVRKRFRSISRSRSRSNSVEPRSPSLSPPRKSRRKSRQYRRSHSPHRSSPQSPRRSRSSSSSPPPKKSNSNHKEKSIINRSSPSPPPSFITPNFNKSPTEQIDESNKGHQMLKRMGWGGTGLGTAGQGIEAPISGGHVRDRQDLYKGVGVNLNDPYENFRKNKGAAFITRMKARAEERS